MISKNLKKAHELWSAQEFVYRWTDARLTAVSLTPFSLGIKMLTGNFCFSMLTDNINVKRIYLHVDVLELNSPLKLTLFQIMLRCKHSDFKFCNS